MSIPNSVRATTVPGDTLRKTTSAAIDSNGTTWPKGTLFRPLAGGHSADHGGVYAEVTIGHERVTFLADRR